MSSVIKPAAPGWSGSVSPAVLRELQGELCEAAEPECPVAGHVEAAAGAPPEAEVAAGRILAEAEERAAAVVAAAQARAAEVMEAARAQGFERGLEEGRAQWHERMEALEARAEAFERDRAAFYEEAEPELAQLSVDIARKLLKQELEQRPDAILTVVRSCMHRLKDREARVRVNPAELDTVRGARESFLSIAEGVTELRIVSDRRVQPGGCIVETPSGNLDARIETQLAHIAEVFEAGAEDALNG